MRQSMKLRKNSFPLSINRPFVLVLEHRPSNMYGLLFRDGTKGGVRHKLRSEEAIRLVWAP